MYNIQRKTLLFSREYCVTFKDIYFEEHLRTAASENEALIFYLYDFEVLRRTEIWRDFLYFLSVDSLLGFFCSIILLTNTYLHKKYYKHCWCMWPFLKIIKVLLVYNPNYSSCFPPGWYYKILAFDLILKWDVETHQVEVMTKELEKIVESY